MNKSLSTVLIVLAVLVLAGGLFFFGTMVGRTTAFGPMMAFGFGSNTRLAPGAAGNDNSVGIGRPYPGMMMGGQRGYGMMGGQGSYGMMRGYVNNSAALAPLTVDQAKAAATKYLANLNNSDLKIAEVMIFQNNAYVLVKESATGRGAFELLVDPASQIAYPEHGPNMMWNLKYGALNHQYMMSGYGAGMMGGRGSMGGYGWGGMDPGGDSAEMSVTSDQAIQYAQKYLDSAIADAAAAKDPTQFYGYYTLDFSKDGKVVGMLSVNGYTGQVFLHTWHSTFIEESEVQ